MTVQEKQVRSAAEDPYRAFNYQVEITGLIVAGFSEVSGLRLEIETEDYREGGVNGFVHKLAGPARYPSNLTLKRGMVDGEVLLDWQKTVATGTIEMRPVSIILFDLKGNEQQRWDFKNAYPVRWSGPELRAATSAVAIETLELVHQGFGQ